MNIELITNEILKASERTVSKQKFVDKIDFEKKVKQFISSIKSKHVHLELKDSSFREDETEQSYQHWKIVFEIIFDLNDKYVDNETYAKGSVYIFPSKQLYDDVTKASNARLGAIPEWNDSRTIGTIIGKARDY
ncbi:MAG: hypothetical protein PHF86_14565 [Candidatus Nanoarchaeia archaeon]|jgi:hypothetical protein|nr:hypothetical protein [Candidatus Nanoarchaeia archaeon]MDD5651614.1 hypothetical protein [Candidatus Nanoarchaeia archaeon]